MLTKLGVDPKIGVVDEADASSRRAAFGGNTFEVEPPPTFLQLCWDAVQDPTLIILIICAIISIVLGLLFEEEKTVAWIEGVAILFSAVIVTLVTATNDFQKEKQFRALNAIVENIPVNVIRNAVRTIVQVRCALQGLSPPPRTLAITPLDNNSRVPSTQTHTPMRAHADART